MLFYIILLWASCLVENKVKYTSNRSGITQKCFLKSFKEVKFKKKKNSYPIDNDMEDIKFIYTGVFFVFF